MSNGIKNMQSAARAGTKRQQQTQGYDDDSGIGGIGMTPVDGLDPYISPESSPETTASGGGHSTHSGGSNGSSGTAYQMGAHPQLQVLGHPGGNPYGNGYGHHQHQHPVGAHHGHGYTSSVASAGSSGDATYMHEQMRAQRMNSAEMGIEAIIHRAPIPNPRGM